MAKKNNPGNPVTEKIDQLKKQVSNLEEKFDTMVIEKPKQSMALSFAIGFAAGSILSLLRRR